MNQSEILDIVRTIPGVADAIEKREAERAAQALNARLACIDAIRATAARGAALDDAIAAQQREVDAANQVLRKQGSALGALLDQRTEVRRHEGVLLDELGSQHGEGALDLELMRLADGRSFLVSQIAALAADIKDAGWVERGTERYLAVQRKREMVERFTGYHRQMTEIYRRALDLRYARISPKELDARLKALLAPLQYFRYA